VVNESCCLPGQLIINTTKSFVVWFGSFLEINLIHRTICRFNMNLQPWHVVNDTCEDCWFWVTKCQLFNLQRQDCSQQSEPGAATSVVLVWAWSPYRTGTLQARPGGTGTLQARPGDTGTLQARPPPSNAGGCTVTGAGEDDGDVASTGSSTA